MTLVAFSALRTYPSVSKMLVVHITDLHLFANPAASLGEHPDQPTHASLCWVLDHIRRTVFEWPHDGFDALVVSGDIAQDETAAAYQLLAAELANRTVKGDSWLARTYFLPGAIKHGCTNR